MELYSPKLRIEQSENSELCAGEVKGMSLAMCISVTILKNRTLISGCEISLAGCDAAILLAESVDEGLSYREGKWHDIPRCYVLNHQIFCRRPLPKRTFDGILLAYSFDPLPKQFQSWMYVSAENQIDR
jgi:hypothetical protein